MTTVYSSKQFLWLKNEKEFVADASNLYVDKDGKSVQQSGNEFWIKSHKTGLEVRARLVRTAKDEDGDITFWQFHMTVNNEIIQVKVFND